MSPDIATALPPLTFLFPEGIWTLVSSFPLWGPLLFYLPLSLPMAPSLLLNHHSCSCLKPSPSSSPCSFLILLHLLKVTTWLQLALEYTSLGSWPQLNSRTIEHQASFLPDTATRVLHAPHVPDSYTSSHGFPQRLSGPPYNAHVGHRASAPSVACPRTMCTVNF